MKILITGGRGFLGACITRALIARGHAVIVGTRKPDSIFQEGIEQVRFFLNDLESARSILSQCDVCVHLAWTSLPLTAQHSPHSDFLDNVTTTAKFAMMCSEVGLSKFLFCSSGGTVYGPMTRPATEQDVLNPISVYGAHKVSTEMALRAAFLGSQTQLRILRVANPYGSTQDTSRPQGLIGHVAKAICDQKSLSIFGDGSQIRDYLHVNDVARAFVQLVEYQGKFIVFNVGSGVGVSSIEIISMLEFIASSRVSVLRTQPRPFDVEYNVLNSERLTSVTGWKPVIPLSDGLRQVYECAKVDKLH